MKRVWRTKEEIRRSIKAVHDPIFKPLDPVLTPKEELALVRCSYNERWLVGDDHGQDQTKSENQNADRVPALD